jgi:proteasome accessory factor B
MVDDIHQADLEAFRKIMDTINQALRENRVLKLSYKSAKGDTSVRDVEPSEVKQNGNLFGHCRMRNETRQFKISNIIDIQILDKVFTPKEYEPKETNEPEIQLDGDKIIY